MLRRLLDRVRARSVPSQLMERGTIGTRKYTILASPNRKVWTFELSPPE